MDRYTEIRDELDKSCEQMDMKSATIHSNEFGKTYTIRFKYGRPNSGSNERSNHSANTEHRTFVISERSEYQMNRNRIRANLFKFSHPGRNYYDKTERPRNCDRSTHSETGLIISPVSNHDHRLSASQLTDDCGAHSSLLDTYSPSHTEAALASIEYAETDHLPPEEFVNEASQLIDIPSVDEFTCKETVESENISFEQAQISTVSSFSALKLPLKNLKLEIIKNTKSTDELSYTDNVEIELDYNLPRDQCSNASENDLLCGICDALPPAGSKLHVCINCNEVLCGYCETLPSSCQHVMAGSEMHKPPVVNSKSNPPAHSTLRRKVKLKSSPPPQCQTDNVENNRTLKTYPNGVRLVERQPTDPNVRWVRLSGDYYILPPRKTRKK